MNEGKTVNKYQVDICRTKEVWKDTDPCCYTKDGETFSNYGISNCAEKSKILIMHYGFIEATQTDQ